MKTKICIECIHVKKLSEFDYHTELENMYACTSEVHAPRNLVTGERKTVFCRDIRKEHPDCEEFVRIGSEYSYDWRDR